MATVGPVVPKQLNYADVLPVAIEPLQMQRLANSCAFVVRAACAVERHTTRGLASSLELQLLLDEPMGEPRPDAPGELCDVVGNAPVREDNAVVVLLEAGS